MASAGMSCTAAWRDQRHRRAGQRLAAGIGAGERGRRAGEARQPVEDVGADHVRLDQLRRPGGEDRIGVIMGGEADRRVGAAAERLGGDPPRLLPAGAGRARSAASRRR